MEPNSAKSIFTFYSCHPNEQHFASQHFAFVQNDLDAGLRYLGFQLEPNGYRIADWAWLIAKLEGCINIWQQRWLSRAGRLALIKSVLETILVYWMSLTWIPKGILNRIK